MRNVLTTVRRAYLELVRNTSKKGSATYDLQAVQGESLADHEILHSADAYDVLRHPPSRAQYDQELKRCSSQPRMNADKPTSPKKQKHNVEKTFSRPRREGKKVHVPSDGYESDSGSDELSVTSVATLAGERCFGDRTIVSSVGYHTDSSACTVDVDYDADVSTLGSD